MSRSRGDGGVDYTCRAIALLFLTISPIGAQVVKVFTGSGILPLRSACARQTRNFSAAARRRIACARLERPRVEPAGVGDGRSSREHVPSQAESLATCSFCPVVAQNGKFPKPTESRRSVRNCAEGRRPGSQRGRECFQKISGSPSATLFVTEKRGFRENYWVVILWIWPSERDPDDHNERHDCQGA